MQPEPTAPATWIFQANPQQYDIAASLAAERVELWNLRQHASKVKLGDRVLVWISGRKSGIYAVGEVISAPMDQPDSTVGRRYWKSAGGHQVWPRVEVRYSQVLLDRPLYKKYLEFDAALTQLAILRQPRGTNFAVSANEWEALNSWLSS
ncbi:EVE domain-containing protein [Deinococcus sp. HMF7604]|uniref:EVE domain-containing protein n=1 Tax=Deinococcus betulae TaxID=2873312 RepID=UPI001CCDF95B|nr:EVE domain-containing protein [Deinococcus betulae]